MEPARERSLSLAFMHAHPAQAARVLEALSASEAAIVFDRAPARLGCNVLAAMLPRKAADCLAVLTDTRIHELLAMMGTQGTVGVLRHLPETRRQVVIAGLPTTIALASSLLLGYPQDTLGAWADPDVMLLPIETSAGRALERMQQSDSANATVLVADSTRRLSGTVDLATLLRAPHSTLLGTLMKRPTSTLAAHAPLSGAMAHPGWEQASVLPVTEPGGEVVGLLSHDAMLRALRRDVSAREAAPAGSAGFPALFAHGYWQALTGMVESGLTLLPRASRVVSSVTPQSPENP